VLGGEQETKMRDKESRSEERRQGKGKRKKNIRCSTVNSGLF
jgi:hypothetical protein